MNRSRVPFRRVLLPVVLALILAVESIAFASSVFAESAATDATPVSAPFAAHPTRVGERNAAEAAPAEALNPWLVPIAEPAEPIHVPVRPATSSINKVKSESKAKPSSGSGGSGGGSSASYGGKNHMWFPALGINRSVYFFSCSSNAYPGNVVYRWGCAGSNNVYLFAHAHAAFKPLHDAYVNGRLRKGMKVSYADSKGKVRTYKLIWWKVTTPTNGGFAFAAQSRPSLTLQTCVGAKSQYRLIVRFVQI
jgi:hypothetical protein